MDGCTLTAGDTAAGPAILGTTEQRDRPRLLTRPGAMIAVLAFVLLVVIILRLGSARQDFLAAFHRLRPELLIWLAVAVPAEIASFLCYASAQRRLLAAGGVSLRRLALLGLTLASTGITALVPGGVVPSSGWLIGQYRRRQVPMPLAVWAVLGGGFVSTVSLLALLLIGAAIAGVGAMVVLAASAAVLVAGSAGFVMLVHRLDRLEGLLARHHAGRGLRIVHRLTDRLAELISFRATLRGGFEVLSYATFNWVFDAACLVSSFGLLGIPVPWRAVLFAYAASQVANSLIPLPAGIGVVAGGIVGALTLTGTPAGDALVAAIVYRVISYWVVAGVGCLLLVLLSHRRPPTRATLGLPAVRLRRDTEKLRPRDRLVLAVSGTTRTVPET